jgi:hypothetical protein
MYKIKLVLMAATVLWIIVHDVNAADKFEVRVTVIDRRDSAMSYTYRLPGYSNATTNANVNCIANPSNVNCAGSSRTTGSYVPPVTGSYTVQGATLALQLPDGRVAVVNCESKYKMRGDGVNRRSCRIPPVDAMQVEFNGNKAKLKWPVSLDGKKLESETYKIVTVSDKPASQTAAVKSDGQK